MTELDPERPLTRREMRLRAQAEELGVPVETLSNPIVEAESAQNTSAPSAPARASDGFGAAQGGVPPRFVQTAHPSEPEIEISPFDEHGNPRSRREMRLLREQAAASAGVNASTDTTGAENATSTAPAIADGATSTESSTTLEGASSAAEGMPPISTGEAPGDLDGASPELADASPEVADDAAAHEVSEELTLDAPTEPFTVAEIQEAEAAADTTPATSSDQESEGVTSEGISSEGISSTSVEAEEPELAPESSLPEILPDPPAEGAVGADEAGEPYSFPDIVPPEEWRSVFDDPESRVSRRNGPGEPDDFDDLITRAVSDEGSTGGLGSSALILPTLPEDTGGLTGPLGGTGQLFVTGSLKMPKSLGETGGQTPMDEIPPVAPTASPATDEPAFVGPQPMAASRAVSARVGQDAPVVSKPAKEQNRVPLILAISGGGLLVLIVGFGVWGWMTGMFG